MIQPSVPSARSEDLRKAATTRLRRGALAFLGCIAAIGLAAAPAGAYLMERATVLTKTASNSSGKKGKSSHCPSGRVAIGGGVSMNPFRTKLAVQVAGPSFQTGDFLTRAAETDPINNNWRLYSRAHCFLQTNNNSNAVLVADGARAIKDVRLVKKKTALQGQTDVATKSAGCGAGYRAIGGGAVVNDTPPEGNFDTNLVLQRSSRSGNTRGWTARARPVDTLQAGGAWRLHVTAICANVFTESGTANYAHPIAVASRTDTNLKGQRETSVGCPFGHPLIIGGGAAILGSSGNKKPHSNLALKGSEPRLTVGGPSWYAWAVKTDPVEATYRLRVWAVCAANALGP